MTPDPPDPAPPPVRAPPADAGLFLTIVEHAPLVITVVEEDGSWRWSSTGGRRILGHPAGFDPAGGILSLIHPDDVHLATAALGEVRTGERGPDEAVRFRVRHADGSWRWMETVGVNLTDEGIVAGIVLYSRDVTDLATAEAERAEALRRARDARRASEERANELSEIQRTRDEFVAGVSHELRTPLTSVVSFAGLLAAQENLSADAREFVDIIERNAHRILRLVDDLLDLASLESGTTRLETVPVDLAAEARTAVREVSPRALAAGVEVSAEGQESVTVQGDPARLREVIDNLISNAVKFTPAGGRVRVGWAPEEGGARLTVADTGIGIPAEDSSRLFTRFERGRNGRHAPGTGLGLVVCRAIVERHGGRIEIRSAPGTGTTAAVHLPSGPGVPAGTGGERS